MNKRFSGLIAFLLIIMGVWLTFNFDQPQSQKDQKVSPTQFSTDRAFAHVEAISQKPHYVGSPAHSKVRNYIVDQLQQLGLEVQTQEDYHLNANGILVKPQNILTRIKGSGNGEAVILMTHYDSAPHSSFGASDAASGVGTILEGVSAFLKKETKPVNDIIILFTDAEELGLNGAEIFIKDHPWAKDAKVALNFEARGSAGNPYMLLETNNGNARLIEAFQNAKIKFPVSNSLAYSIYKMLPNDTDLTVLREKGDINGYNFAFIDNHFNYHTARDNSENLDLNTLAHQGAYLMPLLDYFSKNDLSQLNSDRDLIYFNLPFGEFVSYPFDWVIPMLVVAILIFILLLVYGFRRERLDFLLLLKGFLPVIISSLLSGVAVWALWKFCLYLYPEYAEMEHGFTYNGYFYITLSIFLALAISFLVYHYFLSESRRASGFIAPLGIWISLCTLISIYLTGASYFIIPVFMGLLQLFVMIRQKRPNRILMALLSFPALFLILPFIYNLPVALGLKMLFGTAVLISLLFSLFLPLFLYFKRLKSFAYLCFLIASIFLITAHFNSNFSSERPKPNSLVYLLDVDNQTATWNSYDGMLDDWTKNYFAEDATEGMGTESGFQSKYGSNFKRYADAPVIELKEPGIILKEISLDSTANLRSFSLKIAPNRNVNRIEIFETRDVDFQSCRVNDMLAEGQDLGQNKFHMFTRRWKERLLTYHASNRDTLRIEFSIKKEDRPEFTIYETAYDLLENPELDVKERPAGMIPKPFVVNDATIIKKTLTIE
ncbi:M28 family peptidase [Christiangramia aquimixticola]|uniref:M28 family peptidase n=1 Tax=Christiangramia aquimixticola TaxID=1697558 RepID=UPI003AA84F2B